MIVSQFSEIQTTHHLNHSVFFFQVIYDTLAAQTQLPCILCLLSLYIYLMPSPFSTRCGFELYFRIDIKLYRIKTRQLSHICCDKKIDYKCSRLAFIRSITITVYTMRIALKCAYKFVCHTEMTGNAQKIQCAFCCLVIRW